MGFTKRYINRENLLQFKRRKISELVSFINNSDCLIIEDSWSEKICDLVGSTTNKDILFNKLKEIGFYES